MNRVMFVYLAWPLVGLGSLVAASCLAGVWYINKLEANLGRTVQHDVKRQQVAEELQILLRQLRFHALVYAADQANKSSSPARIKERRDEVLLDEAGFEAAFEAFAREANSADDKDLTDWITSAYQEYRDHLDLPKGAEKLTVTELLAWADAHPVRELLAPCRELADRQQTRMNSSLQRNEEQNRWAGRVLLTIGFLGALGGGLSGYAAARRYSRVVGLLSVRVQAAKAQLDQEVGTLTVAAPQHLGDLDEQLDQVVGRIREMCERLQQQEREILRAEHLAAVGQLAAGVAHEVRNPLTGIKILIEAALLPEHPTPLTTDDLTLIHHEIQRMERTVQELLNYARTPALELRTENVRQLLRSAIEIVRRRADQQRVELNVRQVNPTLEARLDHDQFLSMLTNLLFNALDVTPPGGSVDIAAERAADDSLRIDIIDSGPGIAPEAIDKLFVPFATSKPTGTGLGLTMARRIARNHGGDLKAENLADGGARFTFFLPGTESSHAEVARRR